MDLAVLMRIVSQYAAVIQDILERVAILTLMIVLE
jgi:hypothetical protein